VEEIKVMIEEYKPGVISVMDNSVYSRVVVTKIKHILMMLKMDEKKEPDSNLLMLYET
jgi:hypothetical protein